MLSPKIKLFSYLGGNYIFFGGGGGIPPQNTPWQYIHAWNTMNTVGDAFLNMCSEKHHKQHNLPAYITVQHITWKLTDMKGTRLSSDLNWLYFIAQLTEHWTSKPKVVGSIPIIVKQNFCLSSLDIYSEKHHQQYIYTLPEYRYITSTTYYTMNTLMFTKEHPGVLV